MIGLFIALGIVFVGFVGLLVYFNFWDDDSYSSVPRRYEPKMGDRMYDRTGGWGGHRG